MTSLNSDYTGWVADGWAWESQLVRKAGSFISRRSVVGTQVSTCGVLVGLKALAAISGQVRTREAETGP